MAYSIPNNLSEVELTARQAQLDARKSSYKLDVAVARSLGIRGILTNPESNNSSWNQNFNQANFLAGLNTFANNVFQRNTAKVRGDSVNDIHNLEDKLLDDPTVENTTQFYDELAYSMASGEPSIVKRQAKEYVDALLTWPNSENTKGRNAELFDDGLFGRIPVAGPAPITIHRVSPMELSGFEDRGFPVTDDIFLEGSPFFADDNSLAAMASEGRLYLEDYGVLADLNGQQQNGTSEARFCYSPLALYAEPRGENQQLYCIAIQCRENSRYQDGVLVDGDLFDGLTPWDPIFVPHVPGAATYESDLAGEHADYSWMAAKAIVSQAHNCFHEAGAHLGRAHLLIEGVIISCRRQLPADHPLHGLLFPHFEGTLNINELARVTLINNGGIVDQYMSPLISDFRELVANTIKNYDIGEEMLPRQLAVRNMEDIQYYPYRDDSMALWEAIREYVAAFLGEYYLNDDQVRSDIELQRWWGELTNPRSFGDADGLYPLENGGIYGSYEVQDITFDGAEDGYYTLHVLGPRSNVVELRLNGSPVATADYNWLTTISGSDPSLFQVFEFPGYFSFTVSKSSTGTCNLYELASTIFDGACCLAVNVSLEMVDGISPGDIYETLEYRERLYDVATWVIFTASVQHAAFNYPQGDYFANVALMPGAISKPTPVPGETSQAYWLQLLPPKSETLAQMNLMKRLSNFRHRTLDGLGVDRFSDPLINNAVNTFKNRLLDIDNAINARNNDLPSASKYPYLLSRNIPLSTHI